MNSLIDYVYEELDDICKKYNFTMKSKDNIFVLYVKELTPINIELIDNSIILKHENVERKLSTENLYSEIKNYIFSENSRN